MPTRVSPRELPMAIAAYGREGEKAVVNAMRRAARFGQTALVRTYTRTKDPFRIRASGAYGQAFIVKNITDGAFIANTMHYAVFVERGRKKGKMPPLKPILEWVYQKKLASRPKPLIKVKAPFKNPKKLIGPKQQKEKTPKYGPKQSAKGKKLGRLRARRHAIKNAMGIAQGVRFKIAKHGTKGRWVFKRTMPTIAKRAARETKRELTALSKRPPRR